MTKFTEQKALKLIARCKLTFGKRVELNRVDGLKVGGEGLRVGSLGFRLCCANHSLRCSCVTQQKFFVGTDGG